MTQTKQSDHWAEKEKWAKKQSEEAKPIPFYLPQPTYTIHFILHTSCYMLVLHSQWGVGSFLFDNWYVFDFGFHCTKVHIGSWKLITYILLHGDNTKILPSNTETCSMNFTFLICLRTDIMCTPWILHVMLCVSQWWWNVIASIFMIRNSERMTKGKKNFEANMEYCTQFILLVELERRELFDMLEPNDSHLNLHSSL